MLPDVCLVLDVARWALVFVGCCASFVVCWLLDVVCEFVVCCAVPVDDCWLFVEHGVTCSGSSQWLTVFAKVATTCCTTNTAMLVNVYDGEEISPPLPLRCLAVAGRGLGMAGRGQRRKDASPRTRGSCAAE